MKSRTHTELVPHTIDGKTRMIPVDTPMPAPPLDWDRAVLTGVTAIAAVVVAASVIWSTASIGDLLARVVIAPAAYGAAVVFDLVWIACMAVEWLARYDETGATLPRRAGHCALLVAMGAVAAHGWLAGYAVIGIVGAVVSGLAKGLWTVVLRHQTPHLDPRTREFLRQELADAGIALAVIPVRRRVQRAQAAAEAEQIALTAGAEPDKQPAEEVAPTRRWSKPGLDGPAGTPVEDLATLRGRHGEIVYFLGNGNRVKIGTTRDLMSRIGRLCLRFDNLLCAFHGGHDIERRFHKLFAAHRIGDSEWFEIEGPLAEFIAQHTDDASREAGSASGDARGDADDADHDAREVNDVPPPFPTGGSKSSLILAASSMLRPDAPAAEIAKLLAQHGHAVDTAYIRTVLSRNSRDDEGVGKGGGGYA